MFRSAWTLAGVRLTLLVCFAVRGVPAFAGDEVLELGRQVFLEVAQPQCSICHTLADAEAEGTLAPSLDELKPTEEKAREAVETGPGVMPAYGEILTQEQIEAVARYVATVAGPPSQ